MSARKGELRCTEETSLVFPLAGNSCPGVEPFPSCAWVPEAGLLPITRARCGASYFRSPCQSLTLAVRQAFALDIGHDNTRAVERTMVVAVSLRWHSVARIASAVGRCLLSQACTRRIIERSERRGGLKSASCYFDLVAGCKQFLDAFVLPARNVAEPDGDPQRVPIAARR
jgi:hypothetical protein